MSARRTRLSGRGAFEAMVGDIEAAGSCSGGEPPSAQPSFESWQIAPSRGRPALGAMVFEEHLEPDRFAYLATDHRFIAPQDVQ